MELADHQIAVSIARDEGWQKGYSEGLRMGWRKALLFFLKKQILRHDSDNYVTRKDVWKLETMGVTLARDPEAHEWIDVTDDPLEL